MKDIQSEWIFSFTSPNSDNLSVEPTRGFGAPMWTLLLSVIGSTVFTFSLLVKQVKDPFNRESRDDELRNRL